jgi:hypothetical protein
LAADPPASCTVFQCIPASGSSPSAGSSAAQSTTSSSSYPPTPPRRPMAISLAEYRCSAYQSLPMRRCGSFARHGLATIAGTPAAFGAPVAG